MPFVARVNSHANTVATHPESQHIEWPQSAPPGNSWASQAGPGQAGAQSHAALADHDPVLLAQKTQQAVPEERLGVILQQLQALIEDLRRIYVPAVPESAVTGPASNRSHEAHPPDQQPVWKKKPMAHAIDHAYSERKSTGFRFGLGALAGAGLTAGTFGLLGLGGLGFLGATAAVCGVASFGFLGAGLYAGHKYRSDLLRSYQNSFWQPPPPSHGQNTGSWVPGSYLPAVQQSNRATTQQT